ncbi:MAG: UvrD-helicase domain-containing protein [Acetobacter sp.]|nr:UvrD-helicase domain-containing protein [Acetobacter sp.]
METPLPHQDYLTCLNPEQRLAVETTEGPLLVLAGAGTGKTRVLTTRFAHILLTNRAKPWQILAVTFTNKAAYEMHKRVENLLGMQAGNLWLGTFHALCARMLRRHAEYVGLTKNFTILDTDDQIRLLKQVIEPWHIDTKRWSIQGLLGEIQRWKDRGLTPQQITPTEDTNFADGHARAIYEAYQTRLSQLNACDFGDLMLHVTEILRLNPDILAQYHRLFHYILVDEYQDTNTIQYLWLRLLAHRQNEQTNICCVGDDDQSIYAWRGAEVENILRFEKDFPKAKIIRLERNYRSTSHILGAAAELIAHNSERLGKTLHSGLSDASGEKLAIVNVYDSDTEAQFIGNKITLLREQGFSLAEMAILVRAGFQTRNFEEQLFQIGLPYRIIGGTRFYERAEIRDVLAYLRVLTQPADDLAFERIVNVPKRGIGASTLQKILTTARTMNVPLTIAIPHMLNNGTLKGRSAEQIRDLMKVFSDTRDLLPNKKHIAAVDYLLETSGYLEMWRQDRSLEAEGRLDNIMELLHAIKDFTDIETFLEHVALVTEKDNPNNPNQEEHISIMTLHRAKGLEFDIVFLPGWEEGIFPSQHALDRSETKALEEERRLAYVGITRARKQVTVLHANRRRIYKEWQNSLPSQFLKELPEEHITYYTLNHSFNNFNAPQNQQNRISDYNVTTQSSSPFQLGDCVHHTRFGAGIVTSVERGHLEVAFETAGTKRIMSSYVEKIS